MTDLLLEPAVSLPSLLSTSPLEPDEADGDFTPIANRDSRQFTNKDEEDDFGDDPPSMTLREILLNADTSHFHLLGLSNIFFLTWQVLNFLSGCVEADQDDAVLDGDDTSFVWE